MKYRLILLLCSLFTFANKTSAFQNTIPFTLYKNKIIVKVVIEKKKYNFVFDTGAMSLIDTSIVKLKNDKKTNLNLELEDANNKKENMGVIQIPSLKLKKVNFKKGYFALADLAFVNERSCILIAGIIGSNLMNNMVWQIDFNSQEIILSNSPFNNNNYWSVGFKKEDFSSVPSSKLTIRGQEVEFIWDTGSDNGLSLNDSILAKIVDKNIITVKGYTTTTLYGNNQGKYDLDTMCIAFNNPENSFSICSVQVDGSINQNLLLGIAFLKDYNPVFDYIKNKVYLKMPNSSSKNHTKFDSIKWGFSLMYQNTKLTIADIYDVAEINEFLQPGDIIIQVDNIITQNLDIKKWCTIQDYLENKKWVTLKKEDGTVVKIEKVNFDKYFGKL